MKKHNEKFNLFLNKRTRKACEEATSLSFDDRRTWAFMKTNAQTLDSGFKAYVMSPSLIVFNNDIGHNTEKEKCMFSIKIPGEAGEWTDNEDSYAVGLKKISEDYANEKYLFNLKIYNYEHMMDTPLLDINVYFNKYSLRDYCNGGLENYAQFSNTDDKKTIDKIRNTLSDCIDEAIYDYIN